MFKIVSSGAGHSEGKTEKPSEGGIGWLIRQMVEARGLLDAFNGAAFVAVIGNTKAGKSTGTHGLLGNRLTYKEPVDDTDVDDFSDFVFDENAAAAAPTQASAFIEVVETRVPGPAIGQDPRACTIFPALYPMPDKSLIGDFPGFMDNRSVEAAVLAGVGTQMALSKAGSVNGVVLFIPYQAFQVEGGRLVVESFNNLTLLLRDPFSQEASLLFAITKTPRDMKEVAVKRSLLAHINGFIRAWTSEYGDADASGSKAASTLEMWRLMGRRLKDGVVQYEADREEDVLRLRAAMSKLLPIDSKEFGFALSGEDRATFEWSLDTQMNYALTMHQSLTQLQADISGTRVKLKDLGDMVLGIERRESDFDSDINDTNASITGTQTAISELEADIEKDEARLKDPDALLTGRIDYDEQRTSENRTHECNKKEIRDRFAGFKSAEEQKQRELQVSSVRHRESIAAKNKEITGLKASIDKLKADISRLNAERVELDRTDEIEASCASGSKVLHTRNCWTEVKEIFKTWKKDVHDEYLVKSTFDIKTTYPITRVEREAEGVGGTWSGSHEGSKVDMTWDSGWRRHKDTYPGVRVKLFGRRCDVNAWKIRSLRDRASYLEGEIRHRENQIHDLNADIRSLESQIALANVQIRASQDQITTAKASLDHEITAENSRHTARLSTIDALEALQATGVDTAKRNLEDLIAQKKDRLLHLNEELGRLERNLSRLNDMKMELAAQITELLAQIATKEMDLSTLLSSLEKQVSSLRSQMPGFEAIHYFMMEFFEKGRGLHEVQVQKTWQRFSEAMEGLRTL